VELTLLIFIPIIIFLIGSLPVIVLFFFSETMAAKEGKSNDTVRIAAKYTAWGLITLLALFLTYSFSQTNTDSGFYLKVLDLFWS